MLATNNLFSIFACKNYVNLPFHKWGMRETQILYKISIVDHCCTFAIYVLFVGYDLVSPEKFAEMMKEFEDEIGLQFLKAVHVNDSKGKLMYNVNKNKNK